MFKLLFVYGSLMSGLSAHTFLLDTDFISYGILYGARLIQLKEGYPAVIEGEGRVFGEVYKVDIATLSAIDLFEEFFEEFPEKSTYIRKIKPIKLIPYGEFVDSFVYFLNPEVLEETDFTDVPFGNWREFVKKLMLL
jgi:gamma-glutamylcyclotransferase (GGCT)/AIG2-like uncharacterized protein YtfP